VRLVAAALVSLSLATTPAPAANIPDMPADPDRLAAAIALWRAAAPVPGFLWAGGPADGVAASVAAARYPADARRRDAYRQGLTARLQPVLQRELPRVREQALPCLAKALAVRMTVAELRAAEAFVRTDAGRSFWSATVGMGEDYCYQQPLAAVAGPAIEATDRWMRELSSRR
jgi:hypothetical protein